MSLQPDATAKVDRSATAPFLLRLFWRKSEQLNPHEFSHAPPADTASISDYSALLPTSIRAQSVQIYTWPTCTLSELTGLLTSVLPSSVLPTPAVGTRLVYKLIFPDTRAPTSESGKGKWIDKPLGSVVIGEQAAELDGDAGKTLSDARFVIGDYIACSIYPPGPDGRVAPLPPIMSRGAPPRGPPGPRENGYGYGRGPPSGSYRGGGYGGGGYGGSRGGGGFGAAPPPGDWRRGERPPPPPPGSYGGGYGRGGRGRPY